jgi:hypothetical protein
MSSDLWCAAAAPPADFAHALSNGGEPIARDAGSYAPLANRLAWQLKWELEDLWSAMSQTPTSRLPIFDENDRARVFHRRGDDPAAHNSRAGLRASDEQPQHIYI